MNEPQDTSISAGKLNHATFQHSTALPHILAIREEVAQANGSTRQIHKGLLGRAEYSVYLRGRRISCEFKEQARSSTQ